ncbi:uncharacterized protein LOC105278156 isoform X2 [Ooceraea biroi]|uniref:uncharacterized protein LOC105278156 isoform X2 n=1 Tax=Ooceraea biroi TaxID=2015173 RepID=UPI000F07C89E|nr:uncharacterized protein LOC105278156 isoform X2 [Ooceraea biroi]
MYWSCGSRKPGILCGYIGDQTYHTRCCKSIEKSMNSFRYTCLTYLLLCVMANWEIAAWYVLLAYIPTTLLGGIGVVMLASFCYITDITNENKRAWHLAWLDASTNAGLLIGYLSDV